MLGFKRFETAAITISGIELAEKIRKHQFKTGKLPADPELLQTFWAAMLARLAGPWILLKWPIARSAEFAPKPLKDR